MLGTILMAIIGGTIIGFLGKWVAPGRTRTPIWLTIACGIGGIFIGTFLYTLFFKGNTPGIDWWRHIWQVAVAAVLVTAAANTDSSAPRRGRIPSKPQTNR